jgi:aromatic ring-opening dioxygenase catalytic subunit (LigB family)
MKLTFSTKSYLLLSAKAVVMFTAHFLTEKFKQLGAKTPGFSVVYYFYGFIHHIFQAYLHHLK